MSISIMGLVWSSDFSGSEKLVLLALADWSNEDGCCWPHQKKLAKRCSCSDRNIRKVLTSLEGGGYLKKKNRGRGGLVYFLNLEALKMRNYSSTLKQEKAEPQFHIKAEKNNLMRNCGSGECGTGVPVLYEPPRTTNMQPTKKTAANSSNDLTAHAWFTRWWCHAFEQITEHKYSYTNKSAGVVKNLLKGLELFDLVGRACAYLDLPEAARFPKGAPTLEGFTLAINQLAGACDDSMQDRFFDAGLLNDFDTRLIDFKPWEGQSGMLDDLKQPIRAEG